MTVTVHALVIVSQKSDAATGLLESSARRPTARDTGKESKTVPLPQHPLLIGLWADIRDNFALDSLRGAGGMPKPMIPR